MGGQKEEEQERRSSNKEAKGEGKGWGGRRNAEVSPTPLKATSHLSPRVAPNQRQQQCIFLPPLEPVHSPDLYPPILLLQPVPQHRHLPVVGRQDPYALLLHPSSQQPLEVLLHHQCLSLVPRRALLVLLLFHFASVSVDDHEDGGSLSRLLDPRQLQQRPPPHAICWHQPSRVHGPRAPV